MQRKIMIKKVIEIDIAKCDYIKIECHKCGTATQLTSTPHWEVLECVVCKTKIQENIMELTQLIFEVQKNLKKGGADILSIVSTENA